MSFIKTFLKNAYWYVMGAMSVIAALGGYIYVNGVNSALKEHNDHPTVKEERDDVTFSDVPSVADLGVEVSGQESVYRYLPDEGGGLNAEK